MTKKYYFSVGAIFKNEGHILREWIEHYFFHGAEHIYLINDNSSDNYIEILQPYIDSDKITLYHTDGQCNIPMERQQHYYNYFFRQHFGDTEWLGIFDLDEFLYSPHTIDVTKIIKKYDYNSIIYINWVHFGSSGFIEQPDNVVNNFIHRGHYDSINNGPGGRYNSFKAIVKTDKCSSLQIHTHNIIERLYMNVSFDLEDTPLLLNHYAIQSKDFWKKIKMTRGDSNLYYDLQNWKRDMELFEQMDVNEVIDERLKNQNVVLNET
jgi:hypothetical protein